MAANPLFIYRIPQPSTQKVLPFPRNLGYSSEHFHNPGVPREIASTRLLQKEGVGHGYYDVDQKAGPGWTEQGEQWIGIQIFSWVTSVTFTKTYADIKIYDSIALHMPTNLLRIRPNGVGPLNSTLGNHLTVRVKQIFL